MRTDERQGVLLGQWARARREALGMTQADVWRRMEMPTGDANWLTFLETGQRRSLPETDYLIALSQALRVTMTDVLRGAGVLPIDLEESSQEAPGSHAIHAMVDMIDWVTQPQRREIAEALLRTFLDQDQRATRPKSEVPGATSSQR